MRTEMEREKEALNQIFRGSCGLEIKLWSWIEYRFKFCLCQLLTVCLGKVPSLYCASVIPSINWRWNSSCSVIFWALNETCTYKLLRTGPSNTKHCKHCIRAGCYYRTQIRTPRVMKRKWEATERDRDQNWWQRAGVESSLALAHRWVKSSNPCL